MTAAAGVGVLYAGIAFALGAVLGPARELLLAPRFGGMAAAIVEAALMAGLLAVAARIAVGRLPRPVTRPARAVIGLTGVATVLLLEAALGMAFAATGMEEARAPRSLAERAVLLPLLAWMAALPFLVRQ